MLMRIIDWPQFLEKTLHFGENPSAITVGVFDGVHRGHKALIESVVSFKNDTVPVVVTFRQSQHKINVKNKEAHPGDILSFRQKTEIFESMGISVTIAIEFSESFRRIAGTDFLGILQEHGNVGFLAVGGNFRCGYQLDTDALSIQKYYARQNIPVTILKHLTDGRTPISSSQIRRAIANGDLKAAAAMLGRPFAVDLADASVARFGNEIVYDIAGQRRILPPSGRYNVFLLGENKGGNCKKPTEILVNGGNIIIDRDLSGDFEFVEFLPG